MILNPKDIGWSILSDERDPSIYKKLVITPRGAKAINLPDSIDRLPYPIEKWPDENTYNEIGIFHVIERVGNLVSFWKDLYAICQHGAFLKVYGTYWHNEDAFSDPTCKRGLTNKMFDYLSAIGRKRLLDDFYDDGIACNELKDVDFDVNAVTHISSPLWEGKSDYEREYFMNHYINVAKKVEVGLVCHKPVRTFEE
mgnify:FL=1